MSTDLISKRILFVDDDEHLLTAIRRKLRKQYDVMTALGPEQALKTIQSDGPFAAVVSDFNMPGMTGVELLRHVHDLVPDTIRVMLTGRGDTHLVIEALHEGKIFRFLNKPCDGPALEAVLNDCIEQYRLVRSEHLLTAELNSANQKLRELNEDLENRVNERTATIRALHAFVSELNGLDSLEEVARVVVETSAKMLNSNRVSLMMPDASGEYLRIVAAVGMDRRVQEHVRVPVSATISGFVFAEAHDIVVNQVETPEDGRYNDQVYVSSPLLSAALVTHSRPVGVLNLTGHDGPYDSDSLAELKAIAEAATIALMNQIRRQERNEARDATILALARLAEHRDPETGAHLERVQHYCRVLSEVLAATPKYTGVIDREFIDALVRSSPLHDIGKVGIPDAVLLKPGKLTDEEFTIMKKHPSIGGDTLRGLLKKGMRQPFLEMGMEIAYYHHERFNGSGYPFGKAGTDIPLCARIVALADVYDALTSKRVYKEAMPHAKAAAIIRSESGKHFDPDIVEAFVAHESDFERLAGELSDAIPSKESKSEPVSANKEPAAVTV